MVIPTYGPTNVSKDRVPVTGFFIGDSHEEIVHLATFVKCITTGKPIAYNKPEPSVIFLEHFYYNSGLRGINGKDLTLALAHSSPVVIQNYLHSRNFSHHRDMGIYLHSLGLYCKQHNIRIFGVDVKSSKKMSVFQAIRWRTESVVGSANYYWFKNIKNVCESQLFNCNRFILYGGQAHGKALSKLFGNGFNKYVFKANLEQYDFL